MALVEDSENYHSTIENALTNSSTRARYELELLKLDRSSMKAMNDSTGVQRGGCTEPNPIIGGFFIFSRHPSIPRN